MSLMKKKIEHIQTNPAQLELICARVDALDKQDLSQFKTGDIVYIRSDSRYYDQQQTDAEWYSGQIIKWSTTHGYDHPYYVQFGNGSSNYYNPSDLIYASLVISTTFKNQDMSFLLKKTL